VLDSADLPVDPPGPSGAPESFAEGSAITEKSRGGERVPIEPNSDTERGRRDLLSRAPANKADERAEPAASEDPLLSVVVPCYNEEAVLDALVDATLNALVPEPWEFEFVLVDDGSRDATWATICALAHRDARVRGVRLTRSFGQQAATLAGLRSARGQAIVTMDADLQHPPGLIPTLVRHWLAGTPVVQTERRYAAEPSLVKRTTSRWFSRAFTALTPVPMAPGTNDFRLLDRRVVNQLMQLEEGEYYLRGLINWMSFPTVIVPFEAAPRVAGESKYSFAGMFRLGVTGVTAFSVTPLRVGIAVGLATAVLALLELAYGVVQHYRGIAVPGWSSIIVVVTFLFSVQFVLLGLIGEYLGRVYLMTKRRPPYVIGGETEVDRVGAHTPRWDEAVAPARTWSAGRVD
jgi:polyisoprenyl-phosphate glycosyltransferase